MKIDERIKDLPRQWHIVAYAANLKGLNWQYGINSFFLEIGPNRDWAFNSPFDAITFIVTGELPKVKA